MDAIAANNSIQEALFSVEAEVARSNLKDQSGRKVVVSLIAPLEGETAVTALFFEANSMKEVRVDSLPKATKRALKGMVERATEMRVEIF